MTDTRVSKRDKIKALVVAGSTEGERSAAQSALNRMTGGEPLRITATVFNIDRDETFYEVRFTAVDGRTRNVRLGRELSLTPDLIVSELIRLGASLSDDRKVAREQVQAALRANMLLGAPPNAVPLDWIFHVSEKKSIRIRRSSFASSLFGSFAQS